MVNRCMCEWRSLLPVRQRYGSGKSEIQAKVWYLTAVKHYPLYGASLFRVVYKGFWSYPNSLLVAVNVAGVKFVNMKSKQVGREGVWPVGGRGGVWPMGGRGTSCRRRLIRNDSRYTN